MDSIDERPARRGARRAIRRQGESASHWRVLTAPKAARWSAVAMAVLALFWCAVRFVGLNVSPPGFFMDECRGALHVACLAESGHSADGKPWPLFASAFGDGLYSPTYLYSALAWTRVFGLSPASFRALAAAWSVAAIVGLCLLVRRVTDSRTALLAALAAAMSPWCFQFSRIAWDPPVAPAFLVWGVYFFLISPRAWTAVLSGVALSLAMYSYPSARVQVPLLLVLLLVVERKRLNVARLLAWSCSMATVSMPLVKGTLDGSLTGRANSLAIWTSEYIQSHRGDLKPIAFLVARTLDNLHEHLRPSFLFISGDTNLRHSTQDLGQLGYLDMLGIAIAIVAVARALGRRSRNGHAPFDHAAKLGLIAVVAGLSGVLPAALTREGVPHALRSIGAWPAVALFSSVCLAAWWRRSNIAPTVILLLAVVQTAVFLPRYFTRYPRRAFEAFHGELRRAAEQPEPAAILGTSKTYDDMEVRYFMIYEHGHTCSSSSEALRNLRAQRR